MFAPLSAILFWILCYGDIYQISPLFKVSLSLYYQVNSLVIFQDDVENLLCPNFLWCFQHPLMILGRVNDHTEEVTFLAKVSVPVFNINTNAPILYSKYYDSSPQLFFWCSKLLCIWLVGASSPWVQDLFWQVSLIFEIFLDISHKISRLTLYFSCHKPTFS